MSSVLIPLPMPPASLLTGVEAAVCQALGVSSLRHRSAALALDLPRGGAVGAVFNVIEANWRLCLASAARGASTQNWRWRAPQLQIAPHNTSPEVVLERALVGACERAGRTDWSNQVPVASGVAGPSAERRRAIDLVHQLEASAFEFIELKIASDNPLYAAIEIIGYTAIWLLSREQPSHQSALLDADTIDAVVLAPEAYYARYKLSGLEHQLDNELRALGAERDVELGFRFEAFADVYAAGPYTDQSIEALLASRRRLHP